MFEMFEMFEMFRAPRSTFRISKSILLLFLFYTPLGAWGFLYTKRIKTTIDDCECPRHKF